MSFALHCKLTHPENGYDPDKAQAAELIKTYGPDHVYTIQRMDVGRSSTSLEFYEVGGVFNSVQFDPCDRDGNLYVRFDEPHI